MERPESETVLNIVNDGLFVRESAGDREALTVTDTELVKERQDEKVCVTDTVAQREGRAVAEEHRVGGTERDVLGEKVRTLLRELVAEVVGVDEELGDLRALVVRAAVAVGGDVDERDVRPLGVKDELGVPETVTVPKPSTVAVSLMERVGVARVDAVADGVDDMDREFVTEPVCVVEFREETVLLGDDVAHEADADAELQGDAERETVCEMLRVFVAHIVFDAVMELECVGDTEDVVDAVMETVPTVVTLDDMESVGDMDMDGDMVVVKTPDGDAEFDRDAVPEMAAEAEAGADRDVVPVGGAVAVMVTESVSVDVDETDDVAEYVVWQFAPKVTIWPHMAGPAVLMHFASEPSVGVLHQ